MLDKQYACISVRRKEKQTRERDSLCVRCVHGCVRECVSFSICECIPACVSGQEEITCSLRPTKGLIASSWLHLALPPPPPPPTTAVLPLTLSPRRELQTARGDLANYRAARKTIKDLFIIQPQLSAGRTKNNNNK